VSEPERNQVGRDLKTVQADVRKLAGNLQLICVSINGILRHSVESLSIPRLNFHDSSLFLFRLIALPQVISIIFQRTVQEV
jgi:hypothetical protein